MIECLEAVTEFGEVALSLSKECNIPRAHFVDLCSALQHAYDVYDDTAYERARSNSIRANRSATAAFQRLTKRALEAFSLLDGDTRTAIVRAVESKHEAAFFEPTATRFGKSKLRQLTLDGLLAEMAEAATQCMDRAKLPRGKPADTALKGVVAALRQFWVGKLSRPFYDNFQADFEFSDDPDRGMYTPVSDASRFIVGAVQLLIEDEVDIATCRWMMRAVNEAT